MVDPVKRNWATGLMQRLELPAHLPGPSWSRDRSWARCCRRSQVTLARRNNGYCSGACHDTGSAVAAISARDGVAFLSSGTWSLLGTELDAPVITPDALRLNFTNEGGVNGTTRLLKNVMGLWMLQGCRQSWTAQGRSYDYRELIELAERELLRFVISSIPMTNPSCVLRICSLPSTSFALGPTSRLRKEPGKYVRAVLESLAFKYRLVLRNLEQVTGRAHGADSHHRRRIEESLLNQLTADATGRRVLAGPAEATALGNIAIQILATGGASSLQEVRGIVDRSFPTEVFEPLETDKWDQHAERFEQYCESIYA
jgi:rhamnulokinase